jgi:hypothetical protein
LFPSIESEFPRPCGTIGLSDFCRVFISSFLSFEITGDLHLQYADAPGTRQISLGKINRFHCHPVTNTQTVPMDMGLRCW